MPKATDVLAKEFIMSSLLTGQKRMHSPGYPQPLKMKRGVARIFI